VVVFPYSKGTIKLVAFWSKWISGEIILHEHLEYKWVELNQILEFDFLPADISLANQLFNLNQMLNENER
jgi:hypothetical protein